MFEPFVFYLSYAAQQSPMGVSKLPLKILVLRPVVNSDASDGHRSQPRVSIIPYTQNPQRQGVRCAAALHVDYPEPRTISRRTISPLGCGASLASRSSGSLARP